LTPVVSGAELRYYYEALLRRTLRGFVRYWATSQNVTILFLVKYKRLFV